MYMTKRMICAAAATLAAGVGCGAQSDLPQDEDVGSIHSAIDATPNGRNDVGIIPEIPGVCPMNSPYVEIHTDDEDNNNNSYTSGWTGAIRRDPSGTIFGFCKVNGDYFSYLPQKSYAVLALGPNCPSHADPAWWKFDNQNDRPFDGVKNNNWSTGDIYPNVIPGNAELKFCVFPATSNPYDYANLPIPLPNLNVSYGVFSGAFPYWLAAGHVHTDDEDSETNDGNHPPSKAGSSAEASLLQPFVDFSNDSSRRDSEFEIAKVRADTCTTPCPNGGQYDGIGCWIGTPPLGTTAFVYAGNFYYTPVNGNLCPRKGSGFDSQNCFVSTPPAGSNPSVVNNKWYLRQACNGGPVSACANQALALTGPADVCGASGTPGAYSAIMTGGGTISYEWSTIGGGLSAIPSGSTAQVKSNSSTPTTGKVIVNATVTGCGVYTAVQDAVVSVAPPNLGTLYGPDVICQQGGVYYPTGPGPYKNTCTISPANSLKLGSQLNNKCNVTPGNVPVGGSATLSVTGKNACGTSSPLSRTIWVASTVNGVCPQ